MAARGNPIITLRMSRPMIAALKMYARDHGVSASDVLRQLLEEELRKAGYPLTDEPLEGQIGIE